MISVFCVKTGEKKVNNANIYQRRTSCVYMVGVATVLDCGDTNDNQQGRVGCH